MKITIREYGGWTHKQFSMLEDRFSKQFLEMAAATFCPSIICCAWRIRKMLTFIPEQVELYKYLVSKEGIQVCKEYYKDKPPLDRRRDT